MKAPAAHPFPEIQHRAPQALRSHAANARRHSKRQIRQIAASIRTFGFTNPVLISDAGEILAGHGRVEAAKLLGLATVPTLRLSHLSAAERRAYVLADNKLALKAGWDRELLALELHGLIDLDFDVALTGFSLAEVDLTLRAAKDSARDSVRGGARDGARDSDPERRDAAADVIPPIGGAAVTRPGDLWCLGRHRLLCGDPRGPADYQRLLDGRPADLIFTDPPADASGPDGRSKAAFTGFLAETLGAMASACRDGAIAFVCLDWRHMAELLAAGDQAFGELIDLCVWNQTESGVGTLYRAKHQLVFVYRTGAAPDAHSLGQGAARRRRANVWDYPGVSGEGAESTESPGPEGLARPPRRLKPTALVADAIRDGGRRGDIVLDGFAGSGTTLIAAERCGRAARALEVAPLKCDVIVRRFEQLTGKPARLTTDGLVFAEVAARRSAEAAE